MTVKLSAFNNMQVVSEFEVHSNVDTANTSDGQSTDETHTCGEQYQRLEAMLSQKSTGEGDKSHLRILVESSFTDLLGCQDSLFQIPCFVSKDNSTFFAFINHLD